MAAMLQPAPEPDALVSTATREARWIGEPDRPLLAWFHAGASACGRVAVICPPLGHEYTITHRTLRHLAERLALSGLPCVRFDYDGTGDSAGSDLDPDRVGAWTRSIEVAIASAREWQRGAEVVLVGVRMGGLLAALVAARIPVDTLALWNPCVSGRAALRELQALAAANAEDPASDGGDLECAGYVYTAATRAALGSLDLRKIVPRARRTLLAWRDDVGGDTRLATAWNSLGATVDTLLLPGWSGMMTEHQFSNVPVAALEALVATIGIGGKPGRASGTLPSLPAAAEQPCRFGPDGRLFGILTRPVRDAGKPTVVIFNAGSVHRVGPNRITIEIVRALAAKGHPCFRFDLEGLGDSPGGVRENHPYPATATRDALEAIRYLRQAHGLRRFVALGLCSGAHTTFRLALEGAAPGVEALVMINPLIWRFQEGMNIATVSRVMDQQSYQRSMRDARRWLKLLRGQVNVRRLLHVAAQWPRDLARARWSAFCERYWSAKAPPLARDLAAVLEQPLSMGLFVADGDPSQELLLAGAPLTARRAIDSGRIHLEVIPDSDHTFTRPASRALLVERLVRYLETARSR